MKRFVLGRTVQTAGIANACADLEFLKEVQAAFRRYVNCDWGDTCKEDSNMNDEAVANGNDRIVAKYKTSKGNIFIITEWDRSYTTILFAHEY